MKLYGNITALITPFDEGKVDFVSLAKIIKLQLDAGVNGIVILGSTAEAMTLTHDERNSIIEFTINTVNKKIPVIVGTGTNCTNDTVNNCIKAQEYNADGVMVVCPYYNKPNDEGMGQHFSIVAKSTDLPIVIYNVPSRTACDISDEVIIKIAKFTNIIALKDASGDLARPLILRMKLQQQGQVLDLLSGEDMTALAFNMHAGIGCISVSSNIIPYLCTKVQTLFREKKYEQALELHERLVPLHLALFCDTNPIAVKYAAYYMGYIKTPEMRLPLTSLEKNNVELIKNTIKQIL